MEEVVAASGSTPGYVLVARGVIFEKDTFMPLDAVVKRSGNQVFVNVPKLVAAKMPWGERPSAEEQAEKTGPAAADVTKLYADRSPSVLDAP